MVRVRNLVLAIAAATALTSEMAYALGLGEVKLKSALNQPLVAEIELLDAKNLAAGEVVPVLASAEDFNRAGVDRQYFLTDLTFTPILRPDGKSVIRVSSTKPVREPYLNFLIEVLWPSGRLLREYTLLLDPPLYSPEIAAAVAPQLPVAAPASRPARPAPQPALQPAPVSSSGSALQGENYKVTPNDTLWEIAERARQGGTVHQAMLAIQDLNPDAFIGGNINRMKNGQVLRLPTAEQVRSRSQADAIQQVAQQNASWRQVAGAAPQGARQLDATERGSAGASPSRSERGDSLRLVAPDTGTSTTGGDTGGGKEAAALRDKLAVAEESLDSSRRENVDLKDRLNDLQGQLDKLQRLMQLKDDQLAKLQAQLADGSGQVVDGQAPAESNEVEPVAAPAADQGEPQVSEAAEPAPVVSAPVEPEPATEAPEEKPAPAAPTAPEPEAETDGYISELMANPVLLGVVGGSALLLLLVGLMALSRKNAMKEAELQSSLLSDNEGGNTFYPSSLDGSVDADSAVGMAVAAERDRDTAASLAASGSDPLAEADIYIAYGRFNQAADLLSNALNEEPQRSDLRLKLMEVYAELGDREGFARQEAELREIGGSNAEIEQLKGRYPSMVAAAAVGFMATSSVSDNRTDDLNLDDLELDEPTATNEYVADDSFDLSLDDLALDDESSSFASADETAADLDEFKIDDLEFGSTPEKADEFSFELDEAAKPTDVSFEEELARFSLDLDDRSEAAEMEGNAEPASTEPVGESADSLSVEDFDFEFSEPLQPADMPEEFDLSLDEQSADEPTPVSLASELQQVEAELDNLTRDLAEPLEQTSSPSVAIEPVEPVGEAVDEDFDFFADTDETTTKLDLARAYIDMGDAEGARDILDEVMSEGSDTQQQEARAMLAKLA